MFFDIRDLQDWWMSYELCIDYGWVSYVLIMDELCIDFVYTLFQQGHDSIKRASWFWVVLLNWSSYGTVVDEKSWKLLWISHSLWNDGVSTIFVNVIGHKRLVRFFFKSWIVLLL